MVLEYLNSLLVLYFLLIIPAVSLSKSTLKLNFSVNSSFFSPLFIFSALLNFFFFLFLISIFLFFFYTLFFSEKNLLLDYTQLSMLPKESTYVHFFFIFFFLKLGVAPFHLWKVELFESVRLPYLIFFSTLYVILFFFIFEFFFLQLDFMSSLISVVFFYLIIFFNLVFILLNINSILTLRQFFVLSSLINMNLAFLTLTLLDKVEHPFFLYFIFSYTLLIFILYTYFIYFSGSFRFISSMSFSKNYYFYLFFFFFSILSLSGAAPGLTFFYKLDFLLISLNLSQFFLIILYIFMIILSIAFYFQFFKTNIKRKNELLKKNVIKQLPFSIFFVSFFFFSLLFVFPFFFNFSFFFLSVLRSQQSLFIF